jgi:hypothetical protein
MRPPIAITHNGDSYFFHLADDWSLFRIERFANNQNVVPEEVPLSDVDSDLEAKFQKRLQHEKKARPNPIS